MFKLSSFFCNKKQTWILQTVCKKKYFCRTVLPTEKSNILEFNHYKKKDKMKHVIYADIESLIKKIDHKFKIIYKRFKTTFKRLKIIKKNLLKQK